MEIDYLHLLQPQPLLQLQPLLQHLHLLHLNDAKTPLGSRADRHWHIGEGYIGLKGFKNIVNHPLLDHLPGIMETPRKDLKDDLRNMKVMRSLIRK